MLSAWLSPKWQDNLKAFPQTSRKLPQLKDFYLKLWNCKERIVRFVKYLSDSCHYLQVSFYKKASANLRAVISGIDSNCNCPLRKSRFLLLHLHLDHWSLQCQGLPWAWMGMEESLPWLLFAHCPCAPWESLRPLRSLDTSIPSGLGTRTCWAVTRDVSMCCISLVSCVLLYLLPRVSVLVIHLTWDWE